MPSRWCSARRAARSRRFSARTVLSRWRRRCRPWHGRMTGGRHWSRSRPLTAPTRCSEQSPRIRPCRFPRCLRGKETRSAPRSIRPSSAGSISSPATASRSAMRRSSCAPCSRASRTSSPAGSASARASSSARRRCARAASSSPAASCAGNTGCGYPIATRATAQWRRSRRRRGALTPMPAGISARAARPRRSSNAMSSVSVNTSRWSP